jgi:4,5-dihydroxyphthalate decarboxylase
MTDAAARLSMVIGNYPQTAALLSGAVAAPGLAFDFHDLATTPDVFKRMVRGQEFDLCELAIVTFLQARDHGKPLVLLPITMVGRFPLNQIICRADRTDLTPRNLSDRRIGVRSWTKTSGVWIRAILVDDFGLDPDSVHWLSFEEPHVAEYADPTERAGGGRTIIQMLLDGEIDAAIGEVSSDPRLRPLFADAAAAAKGWHAKRGIVPINHMMVATAALIRARPGIAATIYDLIRRSRAAAPAVTGIDMAPLGLAANRVALESIIDHAVRQRLISRRFALDELFDETTRAL